MATPKKKPEDLLKSGRPTDYKPEHCEQVVALLKQGKALAQICTHFDIARSTLQDWEAMHPEFAAAISRGKEKSESWWIELGLENIDNKEFNSRIYEMNMQNRFGWNKKTELSGNITVKHEESLRELE